MLITRLCGINADIAVGVLGIFEIMQQRLDAHHMLRLVGEERHQGIAPQPVAARFRIPPCELLGGRLDAVFEEVTGRMMGKRIQHADEAMLKIVIQLGTQPTARADRAEGQRVKSGKRRVRLNSHQELLALGVIYKDDSRIHPVSYTHLTLPTNREV